MQKRKAKKSQFKNPKRLERYDDVIEDISDLINFLVERRIKKGWTQADLAEELKIYQSAVGRFESGSSNPTLAFFLRITSALDLQINLEDLPR